MLFFTVMSEFLKCILTAYRDQFKPSYLSMSVQDHLSSLLDSKVFPPAFPFRFIVDSSNDSDEKRAEGYELERVFFRSITPHLKKMNKAIECNQNKWFLVHWFKGIHKQIHKLHCQHSLD
jgi:hypothetical protein